MRNYSKQSGRYASGGQVQITPWREESREAEKKLDRQDREKYEKELDDELPIGRDKAIEQEPLKSYEKLEGDEDDDEDEGA